MKAQKLGLVLGMNMAVACLVMQGCKAVKPEKALPPPEVTPVEQPASQPVVTEIETTPAPSVPGAMVLRTASLSWSMVVDFSLMERMSSTM